MLSAAFVVGGAICAAAFFLPSGENEKTLDSIMNNLFEELNFKRTYTKGDQQIDEYATVEEVCEYQNCIDLVIDLPFGKSYKDLEKLLPAIDTVFGVIDSEVIRNKNRTAIRLYRNRESIPYIDDINKIFKMVNFKNGAGEYATVKEVRKFENYNEIYVNFPIGCTQDDLEKTIKAISTHYKNDCMALKNGNEMILKVYTKVLKDFYPYKFVKTGDLDSFNICLGESKDGELICSLTNDDPHAWFVGTSRWGKSNAVNYVLCNALENYGDRIEFSLIDPKRVELNEYKKCKQTVFHTVEPREAIKHLEELLIEVERRYKKIGEFRNIETYNKYHQDEPMPYRLVIIEEMMMLVNYKKDMVNNLSKLLSTSASAGIYFILTAQRPTGEVIDKNFSNNIGLRVGFKTSDAQESQNAIGISGNEFINVKGRGKAKYQGQYIEFQSYRIEEAKIKEITDKHKSIDDSKNRQKIDSKYDEIVKKAYANANNAKTAAKKGRGI